MYNRLTDEIGGRASDELEFSNGGLAYVIGDIFEQSAATQNFTIVACGTEGYGQGRANERFFNNNTLVDDRSSEGVFPNVKPGAQMVLVTNNLPVGKRRLTGDHVANNINVNSGFFEKLSEKDDSLRNPDLVSINVVKVDPVRGIKLEPTQAYVHPISTRKLTWPVLLPRAMQDVSAGAR